MKKLLALLLIVAVMMGISPLSGFVGIDFSALLTGSGFCTVAGAKDAEKKETVMGDVDGDKKVSSADARLVLRASVGLETFTAAKKALADVDYDGKITSADARLVLRAAVGLETLSERQIIDGSDENQFAERLLTDDADLFVDEERDKLILLLHSIKEEYSFEVVIHTTNTYNGQSSMQYADDYYDNNGYGCGENHDGCILVINMEAREWWLSTRGYGITVLNDSRIQKIGECFTPYLTHSEYYKAMIAFLSQVESYLLS